MDLFYLALLAVILLISLVDVLILKWLFKKINILNVSFKKNLFISVSIKIIIILVTLVIPLMIGDMDTKKIVYWFLISLISSFLIFYAMFGKYYKINIKQAFIVFIPYLMSVILLLGLPYEARFVKELYIKIAQPQKIPEMCYSRPSMKLICEPSLFCTYDSGCMGDDICLSTGGCRAKNSRY